MDAFAMNALRAVPVLLVSLWLVTDGAVALAGFSDGLVGKGKPPVAPPAGQPNVNKPPMEKAPTDSPPQQAVPRGAITGIPVGSLDVVGLKLGMTQEEAVRVLEGRRLELNGKPLSFEVVKERKYETTVQGEEPRTFSLTLSNAKNAAAAFELSEEVVKAPKAMQDQKIQRFIANGQYETFVLQFPNVPNVPNGARVSAITRSQRLAPPVHRDTIRTALTQKYGPPTIDDMMGLVWLTDEVGVPLPSSSQSRSSCRGLALPACAQVAEYDYSLLAIKGCGDQLTVQLQGILDSIMLVQTTLIHHQQLVEQREATAKAALSRFGLTPEQTKQALAPQF